MDSKPDDRAFTRVARVVEAASLTDAELVSAPLDPDQVLEGSPQVHEMDLYVSDDLSVGLWQHSTGASRDVEADEIFVVLSGAATIQVQDGPTLTVGPGDVGFLPAGARTRWTVHQTLRKVYVARG